MSSGRWPANVILGPDAASLLDAQSGIQRDGVAVKRNKDPEASESNAVFGTYKQQPADDQTYGSGGGASRYFLTAWYAPAELEWIYANGLTPYAPER